MKREITMLPASDSRAKQGGIHGVDMRMVLSGELGAVDFCIYTGWMLPSVRLEHNLRHYVPDAMPAYVGYHSPHPKYPEQTPQDNCQLIKGDVCYSDVSYTTSDEVFDVLTKKGSDGVWEWLENYYVELFGELK